MVPRADLDLANREIEELTTEIVQLQDEIQARPRPRDETRPLSTGRGTRRVHLVREGGGGGG